MSSAHNKMLAHVFNGRSTVTLHPDWAPHFSVFSQTPSTVVPLREGTSREEADSLALRLSRLSLAMLLDNKGGVVVRERLIKGNAVS